MSSFKKYFLYHFKKSALRQMLVCFLCVIFSIMQMSGLDEYYSPSGVAFILGVLCSVIPVLELSAFINRRNLDSLFSLPISEALTRSPSWAGVTESVTRTVNQLPLVLLTRGAGSWATHSGFIYFQATVRSGSRSQAGPSPWRASHLKGRESPRAVPLRDVADCFSSPGWSACNFKIYWPHGDSRKWGNSGNYQRLLF